MRTVGLRNGGEGLNLVISVKFTTSLSASGCSHTAKHATVQREPSRDYHRYSMRDSASLEVRQVAFLDAGREGRQ